MNKNILISAAIAAAGAAGYFIYRKFFAGNDQNVAQNNVRSHHLTNAFSKAKKRAVSQA